MKLRTISFIAAMFMLFAGQVANAQVEVGVKGGLNASILSSADFDATQITIDSTNVGTIGVPTTDASSYLVGFHAGAYALFDLGAVNVMPEILYSTKGAKKWTTTAEGGDYNITSHYISIPVLVGLDIADVFTIQVGPQFGFLMDVKRTGDADGESIKDIDPNYDFGGFDLGGVLGVMFDWPGMGHISARYNLGLTPSLTASGFDYANRSLQVAVGIPLYNTDKNVK